MASAYTVLSSSDATITALPPSNCVKAISRNNNSTYRLGAYPNANYSDFGANKTNTQALEIPGGILLYALMPYADRTVTQYSVDLNTAWSVPDLGGGTLAAPGSTYANVNDLANALSAIGGLLMISNGTVINA
jgi:hypothetical protein